jgi:colanic acid biosynthesis glycosyl transferase WcaI
MPASPPRILLLSISWDPEPGPLRGQPLAKWLSEHGYEVEALTSVPSYPLGRTYPGYKMRLWQWEVIDGIRVLRVPLYPSHDSSALRRLTTYVSFMLAAIVFGIPQIKRPDIVYYFDNLPTTGAVAWLISLIYGAKTVQHIADMWPDTPLESGMLNSPALKKLVHGVVGSWCKFLYRRHKKISVLSPGFRRMLLQRGVPDEKIVVSYNWADESKFFRVPMQPSLLRELDIEGRFNVLYAGNIGPLQSIETVIRAAHLLRDHPTLQILIFGTGPSEQAVKDLARELNVSNVRFMGSRPVAEMNAINSAVDCLLVLLRDVPFLHSTIPSKTQVVLACGKPVLIGVKGDASDLVREADAGIVFEPEDPQALAEAMRRMAALSKDELEAMGTRGRAYYESKLSFAIGAKINDGIFQQVLAQD